MKVKLYRKDTIEEYKEKHSNAKKHFDNLLDALEYADWSEPKDITSTINSNLIGNNRVVFDLGGNGQNAFRVICTYKFKPFKKRVYLYVN
jgi:mRNA-degrading endonuclease HigB of HigAB toxin-antitoxin module